MGSPSAPAGGGISWDKGFHPTEYRCVCAGGALLVSKDPDIQQKVSESEGQHLGGYVKALGHLLGWVDEAVWFFVDGFDDNNGLIPEDFQRYADLGRRVRAYAKSRQGIR